MPQRDPVPGERRNRPLRRVAIRDDRRDPVPREECRLLGDDGVGVEARSWPLGLELWQRSA